MDSVTNYKNNFGWLYILTAVVSLEILFIVFYSRFSPNLRLWYNKFGLLAVIADVLIILLAIAIGRYVYTKWIIPYYSNNSGLLFILTVLVVQIIHDICYYFVIVQPWPVGQNAIIDFMKKYGKEGGIWPILGDSSMVITMSTLALLLSKIPVHMNIFILLFAIYMIPYVIAV